MDNKRKQSILKIGNDLWRNRVECNSVKVKPRSTIANTFSLADTNIFGIEVEVENLGIEATASIQTISSSHYWTSTKDGSLRNNGYEFVSYPLKGSEVGYALKFLFATLPTYTDFNDRAGIHVHVNCLEFSVNTIRKILLTYLLFEDYFFSMTKKNRKNSIFCVPIRESVSINDYLFLERKAQGTLKYSALNILPLWDQGTIEFRHLHSTNDIELLERWFKSIDRLVNFCNENQEPFDTFISNILGVKNIDHLGSSIFGDLWVNEYQLTLSVLDGQDLVQMFYFPNGTGTVELVEPIKRKYLQGSLFAYTSVSEGLHNMFIEDEDMEQEGGT